MLSGESGAAFTEHLEDIVEALTTANVNLKVSKSIAVIFANYQRHQSDFRHNHDLHLIPSNSHVIGAVGDSGCVSAFIKVIEQ